MAGPVTSAEQAIEIARGFLAKYHPPIFLWPLRAIKDDEVWLVEMDVGPFFKEVVKVKIAASTGVIVEYDHA